MNFTPGPWIINEERGSDGEVCYLTVCPVRDAYIGTIASVHDAENIKGITRDEAQANARLITAAPDLLNALQVMLLDAAMHDITAECDQARAAIAKATGLNAALTAAAPAGKSLRDALAELVAPKDLEQDPDFRKSLEAAINRHSMENGSNTPDFILATYLADCLRAFDTALRSREQWYGTSLSIGAALAAPAGEPLRAFALAVMEGWPDVGLDGADLQELGIKHGLLALTLPKPTEPCGENCNCAAYFTTDEWAEGVECYRLTALVKTPRATDPAPAPLKDANLSAALRAIVRECRGPEQPYSNDSYLPPHLLDLAVAAIESTETQEHETPLQVIEAMRRDDIERAPSYEELREMNREKRL